MNQIVRRLKTLSLLEIFSILVVFSLLLFVVKYFTQKKETRLVRVEVIKKSWEENYDPYGYKVPFWISDKLKVDQIEKDFAGKTIATLIDMEDYERGSEEADIYLVLKLVTTKNRLTGQYFYKNRPIDLGAPIDVNLNNIALVGQIIDNNYPPKGYPTKEFVVTLRARNQFPSIYTKVTPGLKMLNRANQGLVAEITNVKIESPSIQTFNNTNGMLTATNSENRDILITAKIKVVQIDNGWYFAGHQNIKVSYNVYLFFNQINLYGLEVEDVKEL